MTEAHFLSPSERDLLQKVVNEVLNTRQNTVRRDSGTTDQWTNREDHQAPEVYVAMPQEDVVIRPIRMNPTSTSGEPISMDSGICDIYTITENINADIQISENSTVALDRFQLEKIEADAEVYNTSRRSVVQEMVVVHRDKFGKWVFSAPTPNAGEILVKSSYAFELERFAPVGIDDVTLNPAFSVENHRRYEDAPIYHCTKPTLRHINRFATLIQPLKPGQTGWAIISGRTMSKIAYEIGGSADIPVRPIDRGVPANILEQGGRPIWGTIWGDLDLPQLTDIDIENTYFLTAQGSGLGFDAFGEKLTFGLQALAEPTNGITYMKPSVRAIDARIGFINEAAGSLFDGIDVSCPGQASAVCKNGTWEILLDECPQGCSANRTLEHSAGWYIRDGTFFGLDYPCTEGSVAQNLPCDPETYRFTSEIVHNAPMPPPLTEFSFPELLAYECQYITHCRYDCIESESPGVFNWVTTYTCDTSDQADCRCSALDEDVYPCSENADVKVVFTSCRKKTTTTTTGEPTSTTLPPCTGVCELTCTQQGTSTVFEWAETDDTCDEAGTGDDHCGCDYTYILLSRDCNSNQCGQKVYGICREGGSGYSTSTTTTAAGTTTTFPPCEGECDWTCFQYPNSQKGYWMGSNVCSGWARDCCSCPSPTETCNACNAGDSLTTDCISNPPSTTTTTGIPCTCEETGREACDPLAVDGCTLECQEISMGPSVYDWVNTSTNCPAGGTCPDVDGRDPDCLDKAPNIFTLICDSCTVGLQTTVPCCCPTTTTTSTTSTSTSSTTSSSTSSTTSTTSTTTTAGPCNCIAAGRIDCPRPECHGGSCLWECVENPFSSGNFEFVQFQNDCVDPLIGNIPGALCDIDPNCFGQCNRGNLGQWVGTNACCPTTTTTTAVPTTTTTSTTTTTTTTTTAACTGNCEWTCLSTVWTNVSDDCAPMACGCPSPPLSDCFIPEEGNMESIPCIM